MPTLGKWENTPWMKLTVNYSNPYDSKLRLFVKPDVNEQTSTPTSSCILDLVFSFDFLSTWSTFGQISSCHSKRPVGS